MLSEVKAVEHLGVIFGSGHHMHVVRLCAQLWCPSEATTRRTTAVIAVTTDAAKVSDSDATKAAVVRSEVDFLRRECIDAVASIESASQLHDLKNYLSRLKSQHTEPAASLTSSTS